MIIRATAEKYNGHDVVLMGKNGDKLVKHYLIGDVAYIVPLSSNEVKSQCRMHYEKDGKVWFTQVGEARLGAFNDGKVAGIHRVKTGKQEQDYLVLWTESNGKMFPKYKMPLNDARAAIVELK